MNSKFWDKIADKYSKKAVPNESVYQEKLRKTGEYLNENMEALEFGCGTGTTALKHAPYVKHILATDFSENMIKIAKEKAAIASIDNVDFLQASFDDLDAHGKRYDVVLGMSILHLLPNTLSLLEKVHRMTKENGVFISSTTCIGDFMGWFKYVAPLGEKLGFLPHVEVFKLDYLKEMLEKAGFEIEYLWQPENKSSEAVFIVARKR